MKGTCVLVCLMFGLFSCSQKEDTSIISQELKNKNVVDDVTTQKSKLIQGDFEKDLDTFLKTHTGASTTTDKN